MMLDKQRSLERPPLVVSAPGKTILMGEHAAVYGHPALVAAIDRRLEVTLTAMPEPGVWLDLPPIGVRQGCSWSSLSAHAQGAAQAWESYRRSPSPETFRHVRGDDPAHLVKVALGETAGRLAAHGVTVGEGAPGLRVQVESDIPLGAGFGSSAAVAAALAVAVAAWHGVELDAPTLEQLTLDIERRQHGMPSGIDSTTVLHGGLVWVERHGEESKTLRVEPVASLPTWLEGIRVFHSGLPAQSTGEVVAAVRHLRQQDRRLFDEAMGAMVSATQELRRGLMTMDASSLIRLLRQFQGGLERLGVVPPEIQRVVRQVEELGGAAKISGAGALRGPGAGSLLVFHPEVPELATWPCLDALEPLDIALGAPGVGLRSPA